MNRIKGKLIRECVRNVHVQIVENPSEHRCGLNRQSRRYYSEEKGRKGGSVMVGLGAQGYIWGVSKGEVIEEDTGEIVKAPSVETGKTGVLSTGLSRWIWLGVGKTCTRRSRANPTATPVYVHKLARQERASTIQA